MSSLRRDREYYAYNDFGVAWLGIQETREPHARPRAGPARARERKEQRHPQRRRPHGRAHRLGYHASVSRPAPHPLGCGADRRRARPMPGEVSLAHHGMLVRDELPECRHVLEVLRQRLEESVI
jgi:hypothetical protein